MNPKELDVEIVVKIYTSANTVIRSLENLDKDANGLSASPIYFSYSANISCYSLLRLLKSSSSVHLDPSLGKSSLFQAVNISKRLLPGNYCDLATKNSLIVTQL